MNDNKPAEPALSPAGLSSETAARRLREEGTNDLGLSQRRALHDIIRDVLAEPMFMLLLLAGGIYLLMGDRGEAMILLGFVLIIIAITVLQERRTDNALAALRDLSSPRALVMRNGEALRIAGHDVVREDILLLAEGDAIRGLALLQILNDAVVLKTPNGPRTLPLSSSLSTARRCRSSPGTRAPWPRPTA